MESWESTATGRNNWGRLCGVLSGRQNREYTNCGRRCESVGEKGHQLSRLCSKLSTSVSSVTKTASKKADVLVTAVATQSTDATYGAALLSFQTDGHQKVNQRICVKVI